MKRLAEREGFRTPDTLASMPHFECGAFNHSATSPEPETGLKKPELDGRYVTKRAKTDKGRRAYIASLRQQPGHRPSHARCIQHARNSTAVRKELHGILLTCCLVAVAHRRCCSLMVCEIGLGPWLRGLPDPGA